MLILSNDVQKINSEAHGLIIHIYINEVYGSTFNIETLKVTNSV